MNINRQEVIKAIEEAFPNEPLGKGISLLQAILEDDYITDPKSLTEAKHHDITDDWKKVPDKDLNDAFGMSVFTYLDKDGWRYYLPAAMRFAAKDTFSNTSCDFYTTSHLLDYSPEQLDLFLNLTPQQLRAIGLFLMLMEELLAEASIFSKHMENYGKWKNIVNTSNTSN